KVFQLVCLLELELEFELTEVGYLRFLEAPYPWSPLSVLVLPHPVLVVDGFDNCSLIVLTVLVLIKMVALNRGHPDRSDSKHCKMYPIDVTQKNHGEDIA
nr:hypothetical protein [Tanacetum cinerariifolium]